MGEVTSLMLVLKAAFTLAGFLICAVFAYAGYIYYLRRKFYKLHIPGPKIESFISGHLTLFQRGRAEGKIFYEILLDLFHDYGGAVLLWYYHIPFVVVFGHSFTKEVLLTLDLPKSDLSYANVKFVFGERAAGNGILTECDPRIWHRKRAILNPAFHRHFLSKSMSAFNEICDRFLAKVERFAESQEIFDLADLFSRATLDIIGKVAFGLEVNALEDGHCAFNEAIYVCLQGMQESFSDPLWKIRISRFSFQRKAREAVKFLRNFGRKVITERIEAKESGKTTSIDVLEYIVHLGNTDRSITEDELVDNFLTFFIAGQETTSNQLAFTVYELCKNPQVSNRLTDEIKNVLENRQHVRFEDLNKFQYLGQILKESLRLHPPIAGFTRITPQDTEIGGHRIPARTDIILSQFVTHRDPAVWAEPEVFDPDRFSPVAQSSGVGSGNISGAKYFPFSAGSRNCIGKSLAQIESKVLLAKLYQRFDVIMSPRHGLELEEVITTRMKGGLMCMVKKKV